MSLADMFAGAQNVLLIFPVLITAVSALAIARVGLGIYHMFMNRDSN